MISRRVFLAAFGAITLTGCAVHANNTERPPKPATSQELLTSPLFFIAHRGSGDNWTEHTMRSYRNAIEQGAPAIEVSVHRSADGYFVCHHDSNLRRLCGQDLEIKNLTLEQLSQQRNDARQWLGPNTELEAIPLLTSVLDEFGQRAIIFIEDKTGQFTTELLDLLDQSAVPTDAIVWKQPCSGVGYIEASERGYRTWGFFAPTEFDRIEALAGHFDAIGIHDSADETVIARAVSSGKPVICWEVHTRAQLRELQNQGVTGMMCSNYPYVTTNADNVLPKRDYFATGTRTAGDLPDVLVWKAQPSLLMDEEAVRISGERKAGYVLGSMACMTADSWTLEFEMRWPEIGGENQVAGVGFGIESDTPFRAFESSQTTGFHLQIESPGEISLWQANGASPTRLNRGHLAGVNAGDWIQIHLSSKHNNLDVRAGSLNFSCPLLQHVAPGYLNLLNLIPAALPVDFRRITINSIE